MREDAKYTDRRYFTVPQIIRWSKGVEGEGVHLTLPPNIFSAQVKSGACYITGQWGWVQNKKKKHNPNL